ncbi:single-stranded DNA-binding protein [Microbispora sp. ATCC PTA-5024]|uniref:single-stranded DNA-binding protein n=1 Tax=Microbispora sp. ATCC PTA-5024 TaxID=316330 RepID=UPI0003DD4664|nr:single-stranded DNA-binding protein [Microbispora sp. ATCC PTA-5024]ETK38186.1 hypothetical protein MPTA5024_00015 [Microbispora sp. ATCC PTA-5024]
MHRNEVVLVGRLSMRPMHRELPSGTLLTQWRLAVRRPASRPGHQRSDAIECATFDDGVREMVLGWQVDDVVQVEGAMRRRWWRGGSRYEVEVGTARRLHAAARTPSGEAATEQPDANRTAEVVPAERADVQAPRRPARDEDLEVSRIVNDPSSDEDEG